jgi:hypothetical protein
MIHRTVSGTITFNRPFQLTGFDEPLPAGTYKTETHEELIDGLSFPAYRRVQTLLFLPPSLGQANLIHVATIDPVELAEAHRRDGAASDQLA